MALVFYGTEQSKNPSNSFKHVYVYHNLDEPGKLLKLLRNSSFDKTQNISTFLKWLQFKFKVKWVKIVQMQKKNKSPFISFS